MTLKDYIENYRDNINQYDFIKIYQEAPIRLNSLSAIGRLTELFYKCGVNPLESLSEVPNWFAYDSNIYTIKIPNSIQYIGYNAFKDCKTLTSIIIPKSVTAIETGAFQNCTLLIKYEGTENEWENITKHLDWNRNTAYRIIFNYIE